MNVKNLHLWQFYCIFRFNDWTFFYTKTPGENRGSWRGQQSTINPRIDYRICLVKREMRLVYMTQFCGNWSLQAPIRPITLAKPCPLALIKESLIHDATPPRTYLASSLNVLWEHWLVMFPQCSSRMLPRDSSTYITVDAITALSTLSRWGQSTREVDSPSCALWSCTINPLLPETFFPIKFGDIAKTGFYRLLTHRRDAHRKFFPWPFFF